MRAWVKSYLKDRWVQLGNDEEDFEDFYGDDWACLEVLESGLNANFGDKLSGGSAVFYRTFTSLLGELPEKVYAKLKDSRNVFFAFSDAPGAVVKNYILRKPIESEYLSIVVFPNLSADMPHDALRGEIVHKIACVYLGHVNDNLDETELEADKLADSWGFNNEIKALRDYQDKHRRK
jgi:hypothetical protein